ncbi:MAG: hypothetical protein HZA54_19320 [Planctomycetes bacterium]|nr:hypothetical protein [Planctomycetota bacterium]
MKPAAVVAGLALLALLASALPAQPEGTAWRSRLYPTDWTPGFRDAAGRFLPDFSFAGYHSGERPIPDAPPGPTFDAVAGFHADPQGRTDATAALQAALDAAARARGGIVFLPEGTYRCDGLLQVAHSGILLRGAGPEKTRLRFTRSQGMSDRAHLTFLGRLVPGAPRELAADAENGTFRLRLRDARGLRPGADLAVGWTITDAFVAEHGMTGVWRAFNGQWKPVFRRRVVAVDLRQTPHEVTVDVPLRYPARVRDGAAVREETGYLEEVGVESLAVTTAVEPARAWENVRTHAIRFEGVKDGWLRDLRSIAAPAPEAAGGDHLQNGGLVIVGSKRITVADVTLERAQNRGPSGCGYLFEVSRSGEILLRDCTGRRGRHNFIQNWDFGTSGCVWLRIRSEAGRSLASATDRIGLPGLSEFHHSLAMANLIDGATLDDGWFAGNRGSMSSGAGHSSTQCVFWNCRGKGMLLSWQYGHGYVIGTRELTVTTALFGPFAARTEPADLMEGAGAGATLDPGSLYEDQLARRLAARPR